ncbi:hypothetical protein BDN67DRAFT_1064796 [Paxillus ammoniavirescens]|nr:hypothetical protein BDN67DRAFT_1064796 [Paxillus ammoniavirescens]
MELSELSSTQPNVQAQKILVDAQGNSLKINLQSVELEGRPKLVRTLKSLGALVVSFTKEADIILVDSTTESGKRLIRTWGHDPNNVVLEHTWARSSIDAGRPLLEADNWGGAMAVDDGKPVTIDGVVVDEDELEEVEALVTNPLPTPRVTPVDPTSQQLDHIDLDPPASNAPPVPPPPEPSATQITAVNPFLAEEPMESTRHGTPPIPPQQSQQPPLASQVFPYSQPGSFVQPPQSQNAYPYSSFLPQQVPPSSQSQMIPQQFPHTTFPSSQLQMMQAVPHTPFPSAQSQLMQMGPEVAYNGVNFQPQNVAAIMAIMDVVRHMDQSAWLGQNQMSLTQPPANLNPSSFFLQPQMNLGPTMNGAHTPSLSTRNSQPIGEFEPAAIDPFMSMSLGHSSSGSAGTSFEHQSNAEHLDSRHSTRKSHTKSFHRQLPDEALTPSISRKRPPAVKPTNPPPKRSRKGKEKVVSPESSEDCESEELAAASSDSSSRINLSTSPPTQPRNATAHKQEAEIFLSESGQPLQFFVQVDLHGRHNVVSNIKKNKGKIVNNIADADYLILFTRSETFQGLLNEASALGKSPIQAAFVADCIKEGALLDETGYMLEPGAKAKTLKRGRQNASSMKPATPEASRKTKASKPKPFSAKPKTTAPLSQKPSKDVLNKKAKTTPRSARSSTSKPARKEQEVSISSRSTGSPTPPPPETRKLMKNGKYLFTELEDEYFLDLARHHLNFDPSTSNTALVHKLHKKMPHHPFASWQAHVDKKMKGALDDIRKRANIAKRKNAAETIKLNTEEDEPGPSKRPRFGTSEINSDIAPPLDQPAVQDLEREDFEVITNFFASGGGDDDDDERVWQELDKHVRRCRTASSWPEYYAVHQTEVYTRIEELMNERAGE